VGRVKETSEFIVSGLDSLGYDPKDTELAKHKDLLVFPWRVEPALREEQETRFGQDKHGQGGTLDYRIRTYVSGVVSDSGA
jgi:hypothetical protein